MHVCWGGDEIALAHLSLSLEPQVWDYISVTFNLFRSIFMILVCYNKLKPNMMLNV